MLGCIDCGDSADPGLLHFDHRPGTTKLFNPADTKGTYLDLLAEIEKCDVRCGSCHRRRHWSDGDYDHLDLEAVRGAKR